MWTTIYLMGIAFLSGIYFCDSQEIGWYENLFEMPYFVVLALLWPLFFVVAIAIWCVLSVFDRAIDRWKK